MTAYSSESNRSLLAIRYRRGALELLNQMKLPQEFVFEPASSAAAAWEAIREMKVRGAPAIAIAAALGLAAEVFRLLDVAGVADGGQEGEGSTARPFPIASAAEAVAFLEEKLAYLKTSRPTAVNLFEAADRLAKLARAKASQASPGPKGAIEVLFHYIENAEAMLARDVADNRAIGKFGAEALLEGRGGPISVLTHCNTGSLATAAFGTALGVIRTLHEMGRLHHAFATETRPYNQGARLTAFELVYEGIPGTLITDSMAAFLMARKGTSPADEGIAGVVVGADRVVANGDTANKIGTYQLAIAARYHGIPFYVAAPLTSIDLEKSTGTEIPIEERPSHELTHVHGVRVAAEGIRVWNPSFDVTPAGLIAGIITELGVIRKKPGSDTFAIQEFLEQKSAPVGRNS